MSEPKDGGDMAEFAGVAVEGIRLLLRSRHSPGADCDHLSMSGVCMAQLASLIQGLLFRCKLEARQEATLAERHRITERLRYFADGKRGDERSLILNYVARIESEEQK